MIDQRTKAALATFSACYVKRWLEGNVFDRLFATEVGRKLTGLDIKGKYAIEFGLNLLTAFFDQKLVEDTALKKLVKEVAIDAAPEVSKRLINGTKTRLAGKAESKEEKEVTDVLLGLDDETLIRLLDWLYTLSADERRESVGRMSHLPLDSVMRLAQLPPDARKGLLDLLQPPPPGPAQASATDRWRSFNQEWEKWLEEKGRPEGK